MVKRYATAENAVKHGIFRQFPQSDANSAFASLAVKALPGAGGQEMAAALTRAERQVARCRDSIIEQTQEIEHLLSATPFLCGGALSDVDEALHRLNRMLRYQRGSLCSLRKGRIAVLNTFEGLSTQRRAAG